MGAFELHCGLVEDLLYITYMSRQLKFTFTQ